METNFDKVVADRTIEFIENAKSFTFVIGNPPFEKETEKDAYIKVISKDDKIRYFRPHSYLFFKISGASKKIDEDRDFKKRLNFISNVKMQIVHQIESLYVFISDNNLNSCNLDGIITRINGQIEVIRAELEKEQLEMTEKLNNSQIKANELSKITNVYIAIFTGVAGLYYISELLKNYIPINAPKRTTIIYLVLLSCLMAGTFGYLQMRRVIRRK